MSTTITGTKTVCTELAGYYKVVALTATVSSADDAITISYASHGISAVDAILGYAITGGLDAEFTFVQVTLTDSTTLTVVSTKQDGATATDDFTGTTIAIGVIGH